MPGAWRSTCSAFASGGDDRAGAEPRSWVGCRCQAPSAPVAIQGEAGPPGRGCEASDAASEVSASPSPCGEVWGAAGRLPHARHAGSYQGAPGGAAWASPSGQGGAAPSSRRQALHRPFRPLEVPTGGAGPREPGRGQPRPGRWGSRRRGAGGRCFMPPWPAACRPSQATRDRLGVQPFFDRAPRQRGQVAPLPNHDDPSRSCSREAPPETPASPGSGRWTTWGAGLQACHRGRLACLIPPPSDERLGLLPLIGLAVVGPWPSRRATVRARAAACRSRPALTSSLDRQGVTTADVPTHSPFTSVNSKQWERQQGIPPVTASRCF